MKKVILSLLAFTLIAGCSGYDYYKTNVRYRQKGDDCVYYYNEKAKEFNEDIRSMKDVKKVVYRNVKCEDLYMNDTFGRVQRNDRKVVAPVVSEKYESKRESKCALDTCAKKQTLKNRYVIVPAYAG